MATDSQTTRVRRWFVRFLNAPAGVAYTRVFFDGNPIRFVESDSGIVIYSISENTIDDGGQVVPEKGERFGRDFGVRLVEPKERELRTIDDVGSENE